MSTEKIRELLDEIIACREQIASDPIERCQRCKSKYCECAETLAKEIKSLLEQPPQTEGVKAKDEWVSVETPPEKFGWYLGWGQRFSPTKLLWWDCANWQYPGGESPSCLQHMTHWMPLPEPPQGEVKP